MRLALLFFVGCHAAPPVDAYVWNRHWTPAVREAVAGSHFHALRVLAGEDGEWFDTPALPGMIPVLRVNHGLPSDALWAEFVRRSRRASQIELDADVATAALGDYAAWLAAHDAGGLRRSITALPTWVDSPALPALVAAVDEVVLQVHTVRAPVLFDERVAFADVAAWARVTQRPFTVALPAYRARLLSGEEVAADPREVARALSALPSLVHGVVFFRLGNADDASAWSPQTLAIVAHHQPMEAAVAVVLRAIDPAGSDVWLENHGTIDALAPRSISFAGATTLLPTTGYEAPGQAFTTAHPMWLSPGARVRAGSVRGKDLSVALR